MAAKRKQTPMEKLTQGYKRFIKGKELNDQGKDQFEKAIKKSTKQKPKK